MPSKKRTPFSIKQTAEYVGESLSLWRKAKRMTIADVAGRIGVSVPTVSKLEHGDPSVSLETYLRYGELLGLSPDIKKATDPYENEVGRLLMSQRIPQRVRR